MDFRVETEIVETDTPVVMVRVVVNGQIIGPSVSCQIGAYDVFSCRLCDLVRNVSERAYTKGQHDAKTAMRAAIGALG
jgi:hypothetical protein